jgi:anti-anti-sigma factor
MPPTPELFQIEVADSPIGPLTLQALFEFQAVSRQEINKPVILDLAGIPYMDSAGLGSVIGIYTSCQGSNRAFAIAGLTDRIRTLFQVTKVDGLLPCYATVADAEAVIAQKG